MGGEDWQGMPGFTLELDLDASTPTDPVRLHRLDAVRPFNGVKALEELVGVRGDAEVPRRDLALGEPRVASPTEPVLRLLVGQGGLAAWAPPLPVHVAIREPALVQEQEEPLGPAVVVRA